MFKVLFEMGISLVLCVNWAVSVYSTVCTMFRNFTFGLTDRDVCILAYFLLNSFYRVVNSKK